MNAQNPYPPMNNNIAPMPTQYPWAWAPKCRAPLLHHRVKERGGPPREHKCQTHTEPARAQEVTRKGRLRGEREAAITNITQFMAPASRSLHRAETQ